MIAKRVLDVLVSGSVILMASPLLAGIAALIRLDSPGPSLFIQQRLGLRGRVFRMYKFRTMVRDAEKQGTGLFTYANDPRVTRVGEFLRRTSLDELPQLLNVFLGHMSIVGPRPPVTYELGPYEHLSPRWRSRFAVKPGITGLAQISGRNDLDWNQKVDWDLRYIAKYRRLGIAYDIYILVMTLFVVVSMTNVVEPKR